MESRLSWIILLCALPFWLVAQQEIIVGVRVNPTYGAYADFELNELANNTTDRSTQDLKSFSGDILIEIENSNHIYYRTRIGYRRQRSINSSYNESITGSTREYSSESQINEIRIGEGVGIHHKFDRINLRLGIEVPFIYRQSEHFSDVDEQFDNNGISQGVNKRFYDRPKMYTAGLMLFSGIYYTLWKTVSAGIEFSNGIKYSFSNGSYTVNYESYDPVENITSTVSETRAINTKDYNISFLETSIGFLVKF